VLKDLKKTDGPTVKFDNGEKLKVAAYGTAELSCIVLGGTKTVFLQEHKRIWYH
jgi:hypothetical protein